MLISSEYSELDQVFTHMYENLKKQFIDNTSIILKQLQKLNNQTITSRTNKKKSLISPFNDKIITPFEKTSIDSKYSNSRNVSTLMNHMKPHKSVSM